MDHENNEEHITIIINQKSYKAPKPVMTGAEIKQLASEPLDKLLVEIIDNPDPVAGGDDKIINNEDSVQLKNGMRFRIVNAATFG